MLLLSTFGASLNYQRDANRGEDPELKAFAAKYLPHLQDPLKMAEDLKK